MYNHNLKRRRPYGHEEPTAPSLDQNVPYPTQDLDYSTLPLPVRQVLEDAAQVYGLSGLRLHELACEERERKRQRVTTTFPMAPPYGDVHERAWPSRTSDGRAHEGLASQFSFLEGTRIANGLGNLRIWMCQKCGDESYEPLPDSPSFGYGASKPYAVEKPPMMETSSPEAHQPTALKAPAGSFVDDTTIASRYLENYPPLQPQNRSVMAQPGSRDAMAFANAVAPEGLPEYYGAAQPAEGAVSAVSGGPADLPRGSYVTGHVMAPDQSQAHLGFGDMMPFHRSTAAVPAPTPVPRCTMAPPLSYASRDATSGAPDLGPGGGLSTGGQILMYNSQSRPTARRGPFKTTDEREKTAQTRKIGSCVRCRMQRIRCEINEDDAGGPCLTCRKVSANNKVWRLPCLRYKLTDVKLFKPGQVRGFEWTRRWEDTIIDNITGWASMDTKIVRVTAGYTEHSVPLRVRQFIPQEGDKLERSWVVDGKTRSVRIPPYAIVDLESARKEYSKHIDESLSDCLNAILKAHEPLLWKTYQLAWYMATKDGSVPDEERDLLRVALRLWMAVRLTTRSSIIVGEETLGMPRNIMDETSPIHGCIPLPPVMGAQLDLILIHQIQAGLRRELLDKLQKMLQTNKAKTWFTTYLIMFMLLHNISLITEHDASYARKHGIKRRFAREEKVREYHMGANILLAYFHYCNKHYHPFSRDCKDQDLRALGELDEQKIKFVHDTRNWAQKKKQEWIQVRQAEVFEDDYFFISQLYEETWEPQRTI